MPILIRALILHTLMNTRTLTHIHAFSHTKSHKHTNHNTFVTIYLHLIVIFCTLKLTFPTLYLRVAICGEKSSILHYTSFLDVRRDPRSVVSVFLSQWSEFIYTVGLRHDTECQQNNYDWNKSNIDLNTNLIWKMTCL